ncbi:MAG: V-type ATPase subunit [Clostridiales bacterium]|nr:V-type ATPase subunit [Clostridiales bacterium]
MEKEETQYTYAVARIRVRESSLLSGAFLEQLAAAKSYDECIRLLSEKGWTAGENGTVEEMLACEQKKTWDLIRELAGEDISVFDCFLYANDYHNLKAAIREVRAGVVCPDIYTDQGTMNAGHIRNCVMNGKFGDLPEAMREPAAEALKTLLHTGDGQLSDTMIDRAALDAIYRAGKRSGNGLLAMYGELTVAAADMRIAVRAARTGRDKKFLKQALTPCESLNVDRLAAAAANGGEAIASYLVTTDYADAAEALRRSISAFERWCDNLLIRRIRAQKWEPFGVGPLAAYILARENEIKSVRIILYGKQNALPGEWIRERIRETYV